MPSRTVHDLLIEASQKFGSAPALYQSGRSLTWIKYRQAVEEVAAGLRALGMKRGDVVALDAETRLEFYLADIGTMVAGCIAAALYTSYPPAEQIKTLRACDARAVFVDNPKMLASLLSAAEQPLQVQWVLLTGEADGAITLDALREKGRAAIAQDGALLNRMRGEVGDQDYAILYLTSGATGEPKMGLTRHSALVANCDIGAEVVPVGPQDRSIAFLPSAHITQRVAMELFPLRVGMPVWFSEGLSKMPHELKKIKPTFFVAPPRVWERMYASICTELNKRGAVTKKLFYGALGLGLEAARRRQDGQAVPMWMERALRVAGKVVFGKIRERLGGELRMAVSGAAPLGKDLADFYAAIGVPIYEGYGLTEGGIVALNPVERPRSGSIGKALPGVEIRIAEDGELVFRSPTMFAGYYKDPDATASVLRDGWLHTGDIAYKDDQDYIYITGRKKEVLVSSNGKKIYPALVEGLFKMEPLINQVLLLGDKQPYVAALFTLNPAMAENIKGMEGHKGKPMEEIVGAAPLLAELKRIVGRVNKQLAPFEQIRRYHVLPRDFTIEDGELTPTMKVRRARVFENHRKAISELYLGKDEGT